MGGASSSSGSGVPGGSSPVVLITGCSQGGIGFFVSLEWARRGARVYSSSRCLSTLEALRHIPTIRTMELDVTDRSQVEAAVAQVLADEGRIDVLVNNAGAFPAGGGFDSLVDMDIAGARAAMDVNFYGTVHLCQAVGRHMASRRSGHIINVGSLTSSLPSPYLAVYSASKWAVEGLTHALRNEMRPLNVKVTYLAPCLVRSNIVRPSYLQPAKLGPDSPFGKLQELWAAMYVRAMRSKEAEPADRFATAFVTAMAVRNPPAVWVGGGPALLMCWLTWLLPMPWLDFTLHMLYGIPWSAAPIAG